MISPVLPRDAQSELEASLGAKLTSVRRLSGGCVGDVVLAEFADGSRVVVKRFDEPGKSGIEAYMLRTLAERSALPVPRVLHVAESLLAMEFIEGESRFGEGAERHAAELLAALHGVAAERPGLERDTLIGGLQQPNAPVPGAEDSWVAFFRERRLLHMAREAGRAGRLPPRVLERVERFALRLHEFIDEPSRCSLLHGDVWTTNVLARGDRITGFIDPAVYCGHPEVELAFITLFSTFGRAFFERYHELRPIRDGFFETRRYVYNLFPLLVHVRLFGGGYVGQLEATLDTHAS